jgi:hypothetical protein
MASQKILIIRNALAYFRKNKQWSFVAMMSKEKLGRNYKTLIPVVIVEKHFNLCHSQKSK